MRLAGWLLLSQLSGLIAAEPLLIAHANIIEVETGSVQRDMTIEVRDGSITAIRRSRRQESTSADTVLLDVTGKFLVPGFWDMHAHMRDPKRELPMLVANGVLGIRDMGSVPEQIFDLRRKVRNGEELGPRIVACGPIVDGPSPTNPPISTTAADADSGRAVVHALKEMGSDCVKVHDGLPREAYLAIAAEARRLGLPLVGHIPVRVKTIEAPLAGQRSVEHQIGLRGMSTAEDEIMESERTNDVFARAMREKNFSLIPENIAQKGNRFLDTYGEGKAQSLFRAFRKAGTFLVPTLVTQLSLTFVDELNQKDDPRLRYIPSKVRESWRPENGMLTRYRTPAYIAYRKREFARTLELIPAAHKAGVLFATGTDMSLPFVYPGFGVHDEMALLVKAGLKPIEALRAATVNSARLAGVEKSSGRIAVGMSADLVVLDGDPTRDIGNARNISAVVMQGKLLTRATLDQLLASAADAAR